MSRRNTTKSENRKGIMVICVVLFVLCAALFVRYNSLKEQYQTNAETIEHLEEANPYQSASEARGVSADRCICGRDSKRAAESD